MALGDKVGAGLSCLDRPARHRLILAGRCTFLRKGDFLCAVN